MADKITREKRLTARRVFLDPSTPTSWTVARVTLIAFIVWNLAGSFKSTVTSLTYLFFLIVLSIFFAYLIDPLVKFIRRPFKERNIEKIMPRALAIGIAYIFVFSILGVAISYLAPRVADQARQLAFNLPNYATTLQNNVEELNTRFENYKIPEETQKEINKK